MGVAKAAEAAFFKAKAITEYFGTPRGGRNIAFKAQGSLDGSYRAGKAAAPVRWSQAPGILTFSLML